MERGSGVDIDVPDFGWGDLDEEPLLPDDGSIVPPPPPTPPEPPRRPSGGRGRGRRQGHGEAIPVAVILGSGAVMIFWALLMLLAMNLSAAAGPLAAGLIGAGFWVSYLAMFWFGSRWFAEQVSAGRR